MIKWASTSFMCGRVGVVFSKLLAVPIYNWVLANLS